MNATDLLTYCGLYCDLCDQRVRIPERAQALIESLELAQFEEWGRQHAGYEEFQRLLQVLAEAPDDRRCRSGGCGAPFCAIRKCALEREVLTCPLCPDYPCPHIATLARSEPTLLSDGQRLRAIGVEAWVEEQQERRQRGFCYADVRCGRCEVPGG